ncbi:MAG: large conductance mechanosensitive channel protein MscL [Clostridia bacterium]
MVVKDKKTEKAYVEKIKKPREKKIKKFFDDYKKFASKGNIMDLAIAVVMGAAFTKIVNSLVADIIMPLISLIIGKNSLTNWKWVLDAKNNITLNYGMFFQVILDFVIVSFFIFLFFRIITNSKKKMEEVSKALADELKAKFVKKDDNISSSQIEQVVNDVSKIAQPAEMEQKIQEKIEEKQANNLEIKNADINTQLLTEIRDLLRGLK